MACYHPLEAVQEGGGRVVVGGRCQERVQGRPLWLPCGKCIGCRQVRARDWALRLNHEATLHSQKQFITLTYNDENYTPTLIPEHTTQFIHKLRSSIRRNAIKNNLSINKIKYYVAGEYGEYTQRPHYHLILFGYAFTDLVKQGKDLSKSRRLEQLWGKGYCSIGEVNAQTTAYVTKYVTKLITEGNVEEHYKSVDARTGEIIQRVPEFSRMSLNPAIGKEWITKYYREVYGPRDGVVGKGGKLTPPPKFYDRHIKEHHNELYEEKQLERYRRSFQFQEDTTPERLAVREDCALAKRKQRKTQL